MTELRADDLRVGVVGMGIGQSHLLGWLEVDGARATVCAEIDATKRAQGEAAWGIPGAMSRASARLLCSAITRQSRASPNASWAISGSVSPSVTR